MYSLLKKYNKILLAIFMVFLMVAFIVPTAFQRRGRTATPVIGHIGEERVYEADLGVMKQHWIMLTRYLFAPRGVASPGAPPEMAPLAGALPAVLIEQVDRHPELLYLLVRESERLGVVVPADLIDQAFGQISLRTDDGRMIAPDQGEYPMPQLARAATETLLRILGSFQRGASVVKITRPLVDHRIATQTQEMALRAALFDGEAEAAALPAPSDEDVAAHFARFASLRPDEPTAENPLGLGYRLDDRVKLQFIGLSGADLRRAVLARKSEYDWDVEARKAYLRDPSRFPSTRPSTQPAAFDEVRRAIVDDLIEPQVRELRRNAMDEIQKALREDAARHAAGQAVASGPAFDTYEYLQELAARIEQQHGIRPTTASYANEFLDRAAVSAIDGLGRAQRGGRSVADVAIGSVAPSTRPSAAGDEGALRLLEPSAAFEDDDGGAYVFRLIAVDPAHAPTSPGAQIERVRGDLVALRGYEAARRKADDLLAAARASGLVAAAQAASVPTVSTPVFRPNAFSIGGLSLDPTSAIRLSNEAFALLGRHSAPPVIDRIDLPEARSAVVAEVISLQPLWPVEMRPVLEEQVATTLRNELAMLMQMQWFDVEQVRQRMAFRPAFP